jgi:hypothetical protein
MKVSRRRPGGGKGNFGAALSEAEESQRVSDGSVNWEETLCPYYSSVVSDKSRVDCRGSLGKPYIFGRLKRCSVQHDAISQRNILRDG